MKIFLGLVFCLLFNALPAAAESFSIQDALCGVCDTNFILTNLTKVERLTTLVKKKSDFIFQSFDLLLEKLDSSKVEFGSFFISQTFYLLRFSFQLFPIPPPTFIAHL